MADYLDAGVINFEELEKLRRAINDFAAAHEREKSVRRITIAALVLMVKVGCIILLAFSAAFAQSVRPSASANQSGSPSGLSKPAPVGVCAIPLLPVNTPKGTEFP